MSALKTDPKKKMLSRAQVAQFAQLNQFYQAVTDGDVTLKKRFEKHSPLNNIVLLVDEFRNALVPHKPGKPGNSPQLTQYKISINGKEVVIEKGKPATEADITPLLKVVKGAPMIAKVTVVDAHRPKKQQYLPMGVAFVPRDKDHKKVNAKIFERDIAAGKVYLFGKDMYFTFSNKFDMGDILKYAVFIQCKESAAIGIIDPGVPNDTQR
jgi:hypothetical protein